MCLSLPSSWLKGFEAASDHREGKDPDEDNRKADDSESAPHKNRFNSTTKILTTYKLFRKLRSSAYDQGLADQFRWGEYGELHELNPKLVPCSARHLA